MRVNEIPGVKGGIPFVGKGGLPVMNVQDIMNNGLEMPDGSMVHIWRNPDPGFNPSEPKYVIGGENPWGQGAERSLEASEEAETREQYENYKASDLDISQSYMNSYEAYANRIPDQFKDELNPDTVKATAHYLKYVQNADMDYTSFRNMDTIYDVVRQEIINDLGDDEHVSPEVVDLLANKRMFDKPTFTAERFDIADSMDKGNDFMNTVQMTAKTCENYELFRAYFDDEGCERFMENLGIELPSIDDPALRKEYIDTQLEVYYNDIQQPTFGIQQSTFESPTNRLPGFDDDEELDPDQYKPIAMTPNGDPIYRNPDPQEGEPMFSIGGENPWDPSTSYELPSIDVDPPLPSQPIDYSDFAEDAPVYENQPAAPSVVPDDTPEYNESEFEESTSQNNGYSGYGY
jgi:hypothetical protein